jgi:hypothetical protein
MTTEYKMTSKQQFSALISIWIKYGFLLMLYLFFYGFTLPYFEYIYVIIFLFVIDIFPTLFLHIQYYNQNRKTVFIIDNLNKTATYINPQLNIIFRFTDIAKFEHIESSVGKGAPGWYSFGDYKYCRITLKDNMEIIITCLMISNIRNTLELKFGIKADSKFRALAFISKS